jgi:hypothetical protein
MTDWTRDELVRIGAADELQIAPYRKGDDTLRPYTTIWVVRVGDELYVRSYRGRDGGWFRRALHRREGRIRAGGVERDVTLVEPDAQVHSAIDHAYRTKYARYGDAYMKPMIGPDATAATLRLVPR